MALAAAIVTLDPWRSLGFQSATLANYLGRADGSARRFVLEQGGMVAGLLVVRMPWLRGPYIELLAVLPGRQGSGLGGRMVEWAAAQARMTSANLWACVSAFNSPARAFYAHHGFAEIALLPDLVAAGYDEILLRKQL